MGKALSRVKTSAGSSTVQSLLPGTQELPESVPVTLNPEHASGACSELTRVRRKLGHLLLFPFPTGNKGDLQKRFKAKGLSPADAKGSHARAGIQVRLTG